MIQSDLDKLLGRKQTLIRLEIKKKVQRHTYAHEQATDWSISVFTMLRSQCSWCASAHQAGYRQTVALQGLSDKPYTSVPCPGRT